MEQVRFHKVEDGDTFVGLFEVLENSRCLPRDFPDAETYSPPPWPPQSRCASSTPRRRLKASARSTRS
jgi:hypothetical protein